MIQEIKIGGETRKLSFGFNALAMFGRLTNRPFQKILSFSPETTTLDDFLVLLWCGLKDGARLDKKPFDFTVEDIGDWVTDHPEALADVALMFNEAQPPMEEEDKKKVNAATSP